MIATRTLGVFEDLLGRLDDLAPSDSLNPAPQGYDQAIEDDRALAFLTDDALPLDPTRAAIIAVIDDAVPFAHERLRLGAASRVASVWFQDAPPDPSVPVGADLPLGRELRGAQISRLAAGLDDGTFVDEDALYRAAGLVDFRRDSPQRLAFAVGHGAAVAGLAAGFGSDEAVTARNLPIIAACLPPYVVRDTLGTVAPFYVTLAILYVVHRARRLCRFIERRRGLREGTVRLPVVVNLSFGLTAGPKDGSSDLERLMDAVSAMEANDLGPVRFVIAMGNHRLGRTRARLAANAVEPLQWLIRPEDSTPSFLELWGPARGGAEKPATPVQIECCLPGQTLWLRTSFTTHGTYQRLMQDGREVARAYLQHRAFEGHGREVVTLVVPPTLPERLGTVYGTPGRWSVRVLSPEGGDFDAFVQRDDEVSGYGIQRGRQSRLLDDADPVFDATGRRVLRDGNGRTRGVLRGGTINTFATGREPLRVGGAFAASGATVPYSGLAMDAGSPDAEGDVTAPSALSEVRQAVPVMGGRSGARGEMSGTSMAAPLVTRELACAFAEGVVHDRRRADLAALLRGRLEARGKAGPG
jgi:hypothetical protein